MPSPEELLYPEVGSRNRRMFRGFVIAILSTVVTAFVLFLFSPLFPINIFEGVMGYISFGGIVILSYVFYLTLPPDTESLTKQPDDENSLR